MAHETKTKIVEAAVELFTENGFDATSVQQIVERAGVTKGALYHHFAAKQEILLHMFTERFSRDLAELDRILHSKEDSQQKLRAVVRAIVVSTAAAGQTSAMPAHEVRRFDPGAFAELQSQCRRYRDTVRDLIVTAQHDGLISDRMSPQVVSSAIFGLANSMPAWFRPDGPNTAEDIARELADLVIGGRERDRPRTTAQDIA